MFELRGSCTLSVNRDGSLILSVSRSYFSWRVIYTGRLVFCEMLVKFKRHRLVWFGIIYFG